ncbi:MAG: response regulator [Planctomycetota bacterium]
MNPYVTLILIEDDEDERRLIKRRLVNYGIHLPVLELSDGNAATDLIRRRGLPHPHVIILDLNLPLVTGHKVLEALRIDPLTKFSPVFIMSSSNSPRDKEVCRLLKANDYFVKEECGTELLPLLEAVKKQIEVLTPKS